MSTQWKFTAGAVYGGHPETLIATTLGDLVPGDRVNIETDILARHVARLAEFGVANGGSGPARPAIRGPESAGTDVHHPDTAPKEA